MKALVYKGPRDLAVINVPDAKIKKATNILVKFTTTNICGSDLHKAPEAYKNFDERNEGWTKVVLKRGK